MRRPRPRHSLVRRCVGLGQRQRSCSRLSWSWHVVRTSFRKFHTRPRAKGALYHMSFDNSGFRGKKGQGGQGQGLHHPGWLSHGDRCDNIALIIRPLPRPPRLVLTSARPRLGVGHPQGALWTGRVPELCG